MVHPTIAQLTNFVSASVDKMAATIGSTEFVDEKCETQEICAGREEAATADGEQTCHESVACSGQSASSATLTCAAAARAEEATILKLAMPIVISNFLNFFMNMVDLAMVGQLGREQLAAASLATAYYNTIFYPLSGVAMALDTLLSQTYGAQQYVLYGQWLVSGCAVMSLMCVPVIIALLLSEVVLIGVGLDEELAMRASQFVHLLIPGMLPNVFFMLFTKYLQVRLSDCAHIFTCVVCLCMKMYVLWCVFVCVRVYCFGVCMHVYVCVYIVCVCVCVCHARVQKN